ncbi:MAG TPA: molybdopterin cofactor-binding domain-containing protein, partial [Ktedonobacteraceae bacterium]|nr:molybdopterin cofactor-binding domain-containing protein [Ktedonobacteraceae bacterium]
MTQTVDQETPFAAVGQPVRRVDAPDKLTGQARFAGDLPFPGLLHARLVLSPYAHARIVKLDVSAAMAVPGVFAVYTSETIGLAHAHDVSRILAPLVQQEVFWCGHPVALVLAETEAAAMDGVDAVDVDYEPLPVVIDPVAALHPDSPLARPRRQDEVSEIAGGGAHAAVEKARDEDEETEELSANVSDRAHVHIGDTEAAWREADVVVERTYHTDPVHQSYLEPQTVTVVPDRSGQHLTVYPSTQAMMGTRSAIAEALGMPERQIRVESVPVGGAFGGKFGLYEPLIAAAARASRRPVRLALTRQEDLLAANPAPETVITLKLGARRDGTLIAMQGQAIFDSGIYPGAEVGLGLVLLHSTYRCPNIDLRGYEVLTNKAGVGAYRAPGA